MKRNESHRLTGLIRRFIIDARITWKAPTRNSYNYQQPLCRMYLLNNVRTLPSMHIYALFTYFQKFSQQLLNYHHLLNLPLLHVMPVSNTITSTTIVPHATPNNPDTMRNFVFPCCGHDEYCISSLKFPFPCTGVFSSDNTWNSVICSILAARMFVCFWTLPA